MSGSDASGLDNPIWTCLTTRHAHMALGAALARRYPPEISPLAGLPGAGAGNIAELESQVVVGDDVGLVGPHRPVLSENWETLYASELAQMLRAASSPLPEGDVDVVALGPPDVPEMLALVELTHPGPFRRRTITLGNYIGIRERGTLVAMAGERTWVGDCREVSAVCTHPDVQGRGYARALIGRVVNRMLRAGETPYLHVDIRNEAAIELYSRLGFERRALMPLLHAKRVA
jgi:ribosomal protein S18 acetylase RimI-like enzyme